MRRAGPVRVLVCALAPYAYALTLLLGVLLMAAWLLASAPSVPSELVRPFR
jgi:hypothetical protein